MLTKHTIMIIISFYDSSGKKQKNKSKEQQGKKKMKNKPQN